MKKANYSILVKVHSLYLKATAYYIWDNACCDNFGELDALARKFTNGEAGDKDLGQCTKINFDGESSKLDVWKASKEISMVTKANSRYNEDISVLLDAYNKNGCIFGFQVECSLYEIVRLPLKDKRHRKEKVFGRVFLDSSAVSNVCHYWKG